MPNLQYHDTIIILNSCMIVVIQVKEDPMNRNQSVKDKAQLNVICTFLGKYATYIYKESVNHQNVQFLQNVFQLFLSFLLKKFVTFFDKTCLKCATI